MCKVRLGPHIHATQFVFITMVGFTPSRGDATIHCTRRFSLTLMHMGPTSSQCMARDLHVVVPCDCTEMNLQFEFMLKCFVYHWQLYAKKMKLETPQNQATRFEWFGPTRLVSIFIEGKNVEAELHDTLETILEKTNNNAHVLLTNMPHNISI